MTWRKQIQDVFDFALLVTLLFGKLLCSNEEEYIKCQGRWKQPYKECEGKFYGLCNFLKELWRLEND